MADFFEGLIQNIPAIFYRCQCDENWTMLFINNAIENFTGFPAHEFIGNEVRAFSSIIHPDDIPLVNQAVRHALAQKTFYSVEFRVIAKDQSIKWVTETGCGVFSRAGELKYLDGFIQDISERKQMELALRASEQQIRDMAFTDAVTGLANRNLFSDRLEQMTLNTKRYKSEFALLFIDLDKFKHINDTHGHLLGDEVLRMASERIRETFRESDVIARFGGDEFLVIMKNIRGGTFDIEQVCNKLLEKLGTPYFVDDLELQITASIGVAICPNDSLTSNELIQLADKAMYKAKQIGRNRYYIHNQSQPGEIREGAPEENVEPLASLDENIASST